MQGETEGVGGLKGVEEESLLWMKTGLLLVEPTPVTRMEDLQYVNARSPVTACMDLQKKGFGLWHF